MSIVIALMAFGGVVILAVYALPMAIKAVQVQALRRKCARIRALVLTYDDGPGLTLTDALLKMLESAGARATFFVIGSEAESNAERLDRLVAAGHEVACHSRDHWHPWRTAPWKSLVDMRRGYQAIARWSSPRAMYRPPFGKITLPTMIALAYQGSRLAWWSHDSGDTYTRLPDARLVMEAIEANGGGVVLMHDFDRKGNPEERHAFVLETTDLLLALARRLNLRVVTMRELMEVDDG